MGFLIALLTVVLVLDCLVLILLVLIQLPKKEAGMGLAFGGAATDALFGAGSGNVLTKITKYAAAAFFGLAVLIALMQGWAQHRTATEFGQKIQQASPPAGMPAPSRQATTPSSTPQSPAAVPGTNLLTTTLPAVESTNLPIAIPPTSAPTNAPK
jgi:preprotein translocase subunit SecG